MTNMRQLRLILLGLSIPGALASSACRRPAASPSDKSPATANLSMPAPKPQDTPAVRDHLDPQMEKAIETRYGNDEKKKAEIREEMLQLRAQGDIADQLKSENRQTMIVPAAPDFKPEAVDRKIRLRLTLEKTKIRPEEFLRWRLEITNVGRKPLDYEEHQASLLKYGGLLNSDWIHFYVTRPNGKREELIPASAWDKTHQDSDPYPPDSGFFSLPVPKGLSPEQKENWLRETNARSAASGHFQVRIEPGETLRSLGDGDVAGSSAFRTLYCEQDFIKTGKYRIETIFDDRPMPPSKRYIEFSLRTGGTKEQIQKNYETRLKTALGPAKSNVIEFEVAR